MPASSSSRSTTWSAGELALIRLADDDRRVAGGRDALACRAVNSTEPGQSTKVMLSPMKPVVATFGSTLMAVGARLGAAVSHRAAIGDFSSALKRPGSLENGFEQRGLSALKGPDDGDAPWTRETSTCGFLLRARHAHGLLPGVGVGRASSAGQLSL